MNFGCSYLKFIGRGIKKIIIDFVFYIINDFKGIRYFFIFNKIKYKEMIRNNKINFKYNNRREVVG